MNILVNSNQKHNIWKTLEKENKIKIKFEVDDKMNYRIINMPEDSMDTIYNLYREFREFSSLNFLYKGKWLFGASFDNERDNN